MIVSTIQDIKGLMKYLGVPGSVYYTTSSATYVLDIPTEVAPIYIEYRTMVNLDSVINTIQREKFLFDTYKGKTGVIWT